MPAFHILPAPRLPAGVRWRGWCLGLVLLAVLLPAAWAGRTCDAPQPPRVQDIERGLLLADRVRQQLDASGADVVLLARAGQDLSRYGLRYSHVGWVYRQADPQAPGGHVWRVLHKLNQCGSDSSALYRQGLGEFFLDTPWRYEAAWVVPRPALQASLRPWLVDAPGRQRPAALQLQHRPYSLVSYAWGQRYQQSNQWAIELLAWSAVGPGPDRAPTGSTAVLRAQAQGWLRQQGYQPTVLRIGPLTRLGARATAANIAFDDHPGVERFSDRIATVTADSVFDWLVRQQLGGPVQRVGL